MYRADQEGEYGGWETQDGGRFAQGKGGEDKEGEGQYGRDDRVRGGVGRAEYQKEAGMGGTCQTGRKQSWEAYTRSGRSRRWVMAGVMMYTLLLLRLSGSPSSLLLALPGSRLLHKPKDAGMEGACETSRV